MKLSQRKYQTIDLLELYSKADYKAWNWFLTVCRDNRDIKKLEQTRYGLQAGMSDITKKGFNTPEITNFFLRLQKSIENTLRAIWKEKSNNPLYMPNATPTNEMKADKKRQDERFERYLRETSF